MTDTLCKSTLEIEKLAADWLANRDRDDWNAEDQIRLDHWLTKIACPRNRLLAA